MIACVKYVYFLPNTCLILYLSLENLSTHITILVVIALYLINFRLLCSPFLASWDYYCEVSKVRTLAAKNIDNQSVASKRRKISKKKFLASILPNFFVTISASKMGQIKKIKALFYINYLAPN